MRNLILVALIICGTSAIAQSTIDKTEILRDIQVLSADSLEGRKTGTPGLEKAKKYILSRFEEIGISKIDESYVREFKVSKGEKTAYNIIGYLPGEIDNCIVITAHYDHLGIKDGKIFNGADDNASGVAGLLAIAEDLKAKGLTHSMVFVAFDAEEMGLLGAKDFVKSPALKKNQIKLNVNMDMISRNEKNEIYACGTYHYPTLKDYLSKVEHPSVKLMFGHDRPEQGHNDWTQSSDHGPFHKAKIPFIYFGVEDHKDYHKHTDVFENIEPDFYVNAIELIIASIRKLDEGLANQ